MANIHLIIGSCPKPFIDKFDTIQQNAIGSWSAATHPSVTKSIYLMGNESGTEQAAAMYGCTYVPDIEYNTFGTPLVSSIFNRLKEIGSQTTVSPDTKIVYCYINCDIIIFDEFLTNIVAYHSNDISDTPLPYLLVGTRWDIDGIGKIDFNRDDWATTVRRYSLATGSSHSYGGIDYFIYGPNTFKYIYPFALGKFVWDQWLVGNVYRKDSITVDISLTNLVLHQNGDWYQSCSGGCTTDRKALYQTEEVKINDSFDYYRKDIFTGTRYESSLVDSAIVYAKK